jgi:hypothetical protein
MVMRWTSVRITTSETIFAMPGFSPGIRQGVVVSLAVKTCKSDEPHRHHPD